MTDDNDDPGPDWAVHYEYTPYGTETIDEESHSASASYHYNIYRYTGRDGTFSFDVEEDDAQSRANMGHWYNYRSRSYLPQMARFTSKDSFSGFLSRPASLNKFCMLKASRWGERIRGVTLLSNKKIVYLLKN